MKLDESDVGTRYGLYWIHNRTHRGQIPLVWKNGSEYRFTVHDDPHPEHSLGSGGDWVCIGELTWTVVDGKYIHELLPLRQRPLTLASCEFYSPGKC